MKRILVITISFVLICNFAIAEIDLSSLSFDELRELQAQISIELATRAEWKEVPVPPGVYQVGVDIPAGDWCLKCGDSDFGSVFINYGSKLNESCTKIEDSDWFGNIYKEPSASEIAFKYIRMTTGYYLYVSEGTVIFTQTEKILGF